MRKPDWCKGKLINWFLLMDKGIKKVHVDVVFIYIYIFIFFSPKHFWKIIRWNLFVRVKTRIFFFLFSPHPSCNSTGLVIELKIRRRPRRATRWNLKCLLLLSRQRVIRIVWELDKNINWAPDFFRYCRSYRRYQKFPSLIFDFDKSRRAIP